MCNTGISSCVSFVKQCATKKLTHLIQGDKYPCLYNISLLIAKEDALILFFLTCFSSFDKYLINCFRQSPVVSNDDTESCSTMDFVFSISTKTLFARFGNVEDVSFLRVSALIFF